VVGTLLGVLAGLSLASSLEKVIALVERLFRFKILPPSVYFIDKFPVQINYSDVALIAVSALILSLAATIYPSWQAARVAPAQALRYE
jgi:lipoprotein-releasing system permease protein